MLGFLKMKKTILIIVAIFTASLSAIAFMDYRSYNRSNALYKEELRIRELLSEYDKVISEADSIRLKINILKSRNIDNEEFEKVLDRSRAFLEKAEKVKSRKIELTKERDEIVSKINEVPKQILFFKNRTPNIKSNEMQQDS